jgi:hypothetical protein
MQLIVLFWIFFVCVFPESFAGDLELNHKVYPQLGSQPPLVSVHHDTSPIWPSPLFHCSRKRTNSSVYKWQLLSYTPGLLWDRQRKVARFFFKKYIKYLVIPKRAPGKDYLYLCAVFFFFANGLVQYRK